MDTLKPQSSKKQRPKDVNYTRPKDVNYTRPKDVNYTRATATVYDSDPEEYDDMSEMMGF